MSRSIRKMFVYAALLALLAPALGGCGSSDDPATVPPATVPPTTEPPATKVSTFSVKDTSGAAVVGATVYAIPVADVEALAAVAIGRDAATFGNYSAEALTVDEPLEDLINNKFAGSTVATYKKAVTDADGKAAIAELANDASKYFVYVQPATEDAHLPGGSLCREAVTGASLFDKVTEVKVSTKPSAAATFVGTSNCLGCHPGQAGMLKTAHKLGFMVPNAPSLLQDASSFNDAADPDYDMFGAVKKFEAGTTIWFYDYDATRGFDKYKTLESDPRLDATFTGKVYAKVTTSKDAAGKYWAEFINVINPSDSNSGMKLEILMTYGGAVYKQRPITAVEGSMFLVPLQFNTRGDEASTDRVRKQWRDYHLDWWLTIDATDETKSTFKTKPAAKNSVDVACASCHFNGYTLTEINGSGYYQATGVVDAARGEVHPALGTKQELNLGCENCHGPGSEHVAAGGAGKFIVSPQNMTPEREIAICGQCHSRPQGKGTFVNDQPVNADNKMMVAGTSRADYLTNYTSRNDSNTGDMHADGIHSKSHHQQYTDFIQSSKYRNGSKLLTCASCHDLHKPGTDRHQLSGATDGSMCVSCHTTVETAAHTVAKVGVDHAVALAQAQCIQCHNPKTANSGAGINQTANEAFVGSDGKARLHGDISSHIFDVPNKTLAMPVAYTAPKAINSPQGKCGLCHSL